MNLRHEFCHQLKARLSRRYCLHSVHCLVETLHQLLQNRHKSYVIWRHCRGNVTSRPVYTFAEFCCKQLVRSARFCFYISRCFSSTPCRSSSSSSSSNNGVDSIPSNIAPRSSAFCTVWELASVYSAGISARLYRQWLELPQPSLLEDQYSSSLSLPVPRKHWNSLWGTPSMHNATVGATQTVAPTVSLRKHSIKFCHNLFIAYSACLVL